MIYNAKNVVGLIQKTFSLSFAVSDRVFSGKGELGKSISVLKNLQEYQLMIG
ncbi:hypothetical protein Pelsub_P0968 [Pelolinea submarina]|uniref:Uncharacterized protein n=1 Tax=Pelolinea submarina TaxID=913107 RepID=A0A347ZR10_9CHLR|nr:hypothetical protein DFR64_1597 [Pelolinea submarina]BBB47741.1 hypothetical protein Pelsub_P0968 [Pelolinea submarina]